MKNFLLGVGVGTVLGYLFFQDIDKAIRQGMERANEGGDSPTTSSTYRPTPPETTTPEQS